MRSERAARRGGRRAWLWWLVGAVVALGLVLAGVGAYYAHHAEPLVKASLVRLLKERFHARVELDGFHLAVGAGVVAEAEGLRIWLPDSDAGIVGADAGPWLRNPWITVARMRFAASMSFLRGGPVRVSTIHVDGVRILVPPKGYRLELAGGASPSRLGELFQAVRKGAGLKVPEMVVERIECQDVFLQMERDPAGEDAVAVGAEGKPRAGVQAASTAAGKKLPAAKEALQFQIESLELRPESRGGAMGFQLRMTNPRPKGMIDAGGELGPWNLARTSGVAGGVFDPGGLPLRGEYRLEHADLSTIRGIAGRLDSAGDFAGTLREMKVNGETETPDFRLTRKGVVPPARTGVALWTRFAATVDGTSGNTALDRVEAKLGSTHMWARGEIVRIAENGALGQRLGHDLKLEVNVDYGRIGDFLRLVTANETPLVTGAIQLKNSLHLPPGEESFRQRLELKGSFHATGVHFTNAKVERGIAQLSLRGQGHPEQLGGAGSASIASEMSGSFELTSGVLNLPDLLYQVPGADVHVQGTYTLEDGALSFAGDARMKASLSAMVGGWKGFLLKPMNHMLARNGAGTDIPIHLTGTRAEPKFGVDWDRIGKSNPASGGQRQ